MFSQDRSVLRDTYVDAWNKARDGAPLEPLERQIVSIIEQHPEYQPLLEADDGVLDRDWLPEHGETNPFLHMALHLALYEQVQTDRPPGIRKVYQQAIRHALGDVHDAEHQIMECLAETLWQVLHDGGEANLKRYLKCIKRGWRSR
jgi:hypothetical protein